MANETATSSKAAAVPHFSTNFPRVCPKLCFVLWLLLLLLLFLYSGVLLLPLFVHNFHNLLLNFYGLRRQPAAVTNLHLDMSYNRA